MDVQELIDDLEALSKELRNYERKYLVASQTFHDLYTQGKLADDDFDTTCEYGTWVGMYETSLDREREFHELSTATLRDRAERADDRPLLPQRERELVAAK